ncbi:MAG: preprotein translocase subunit SecA [Spirochaetia bacterium]|nr:preprotein translocase subunit SecA [Spirochaetia bacterium]
MLQKALTLVFGSKHERDIKKIMPIIAEIGRLESAMQALSNDELRAKTQEFKDALAAGKTLDDILPEAFAAVREASVRTLGMRHFDVQMIGGIVLHHGKIAEMKTGEGKTLTSTSAIYLNALSGKGVHVVTVNDYLARRDALWMKPIYDLLGISVGIIQHDMDYAERQAAYAADVTYGTNNEFGFDFLRDNMVTEREFRVQRTYNFAIVDEVDSILIDEARTPLIISGPTEENVERYSVVDKAIRRLVAEEERAPEPPPIEVEPGKEEPHVLRGFYYDIDEKSRNVLLTEDGVHKMEELLGVENLFAPDNQELVAHTTAALRAHLIYKDEVDYVVRDNEVIIVDEHTGRLMEGRRYSDGLHQAIEAKENVEIKQETQTLATITFQNFFRIYTKLSGMTGTADTEAEEFKKIYKLDVVVIPTNVLVIRKDYPDRVYLTEADKFNAIIAEIRDCRERKQPVLVGTVSIEKSEFLSALLKKEGIAHSVLNAKQHEKEAEVVANAGKGGTVTVATNMAGRGTDIVLGGAPLYLKDLDTIEDTDDVVAEIKNKIRRKDFDGARSQLPRIEGAARQQLLKEVVDRAEIWKKSHEEVRAAGGLHILGTERHEARRIDNQLRGRSGRQGDPGSSRFYLSLEDNLMRIFGGPRIKGLMERLGMTEGQELEAGMVDRAIARAQKRVESHNFDIRKHLLEYDDVMNRQREYIYRERNVILENIGVREKILTFAEEVIEAKILELCEGGDSMRWDLEGLTEWLRSGLGLDITINRDDFGRSSKAQVELYNYVMKECREAYAAKAQEIGEENFSYVERRIALDVIDARWKEHLYTMDHLREGIWSTSYAERNPLVEYKLEGFRLFDAMIAVIKEQVTEFLFRVQIEGPVSQAPARRISGEASHQTKESFDTSDPLSGDGRATPVSNKKNAHDHAVSGGGSSKRKASRRRRK